MYSHKRNTVQFESLVMHMSSYLVRLPSAVLQGVGPVQVPLKILGPDTFAAYTPGVHMNFSCKLYVPFAAPLFKAMPETVFVNVAASSPLLGFAGAAVKLTQLNQSNRSRNAARVERI